MKLITIPCSRKLARELPRIMIPLGRLTLPQNSNLGGRRIIRDQVEEELSGSKMKTVAGIKKESMTGMKKSSCADIDINTLGVIAQSQ